MTVKFWTESIITYVNLPGLSYFLGVKRCGLEFPTGIEDDGTELARGVGVLIITAPMPVQ
jgi:hypothetical protein